MPNKTLTFGADVLPSESGTFNLGNANTQWKLNGKTVGGAVEKDVDTSISSEPGANLPTSAAVASFVENKGYLTARVDGTTLIIE